MSAVRSRFPVVLAALAAIPMAARPATLDLSRGPGRRPGSASKTWEPPSGTGVQGAMAIVKGCKPTWMGLPAVLVAVEIGVTVLVS